MPSTHVLTRTHTARLRAVLRCEVILNNIGSGFAVFLAKAGHHITLIARPGSVRLLQLQRYGGIKTEEDEVLPMRYLEAFDEKTPYDFVIVTVLAHQVDALLPVLRRSRAHVIMFNVFNPERIKTAMEKNRVYLVCPLS